MARGGRIVDGYKVINVDNINDNLGKFIINQVVMKHKKAVRRCKNLPVLNSYDILNFKDIKKLTFDNFLNDPNHHNFKWGNITDFYRDVTSEDVVLMSNNEWDSISYFYQKNNNIIPLRFRISSSRYDKAFITDLFEFLEPPKTSHKIIQYYGDVDLQLSEFTLIIENDLILNFDGSEMMFFINPSIHLERVESNPFYILIRLLNDYKKLSIDKNQINIVYKGDYGFEKMAFDIKKIDIDINLNYNDDFKEISDAIILNLNNKKKTGLYILRGDNGTGKTTWIRYLAGKIKRNIIFVSPDMVDHITDPSFIPFLMNNSDSVLIIEDAEPALQKRDGVARTGAISNILNLTDGLLSDCLNISIVATFNTKTNTVLDEALLRDGRLIKSYAFEKLEKNKSTILLKKLGHNVEAPGPMKLSEIYFYGEDNNSKSFEQKNIMGFKK